MGYGPAYTIVFVDEKNRRGRTELRHRRWPEGRARSPLDAFRTVCGRSVFPDKGHIIFVSPQSSVPSCKECRKNPWAPKHIEGSTRRAITDPKILQQIKFEYVELGLSCTEIGRRHHVQKTTIKNYLVEMGVTLRPKGGIIGGTHSIPQKEIARIRFLYWDCELSTAEVGKVLGIPQGTVISRMQRAGIPRRSRAESARLPWKRGVRKDSQKRAKNFAREPAPLPVLKAA